MRKLADTKLNTNQPFLGYVGTGARLKVVVKNDGISIRETSISQWSLIFTLGLIAFYPFWILVFRHDKINGGLFGRCLLGIGSAVGVIFFAKYFVRLLRAPRIDVQKTEQKVIFYSSSRSISKTIRFPEIASIQCIGLDGVGQGDSALIYSLTIVDQSNIVHNLCSSDSKANIDEIQKKLVEIIPGVAR